MKKFKLNIEARKEGEWSNFSVLDGNKNIVAQETGSFSLDLPKGLYSILEESGNTIKKEIVVLNDNITYSSKKFTEKSSVKKKKSRKKYLNDAYERGKKISERELSDTSALSPLLLFMYVDSDDFKKSWFSIKDQI